MPKTLNSSFATYTTMMRITKKGRPYAKDLYDMFSAVLLQIQLTDHRSLFRTYPNTFNTEEAIKVMSSLQFIHMHRQPDPSDPSLQIATRTTTTFSMDSTTAKSMLQHFLLAHLIQNATDPSNWSMRDKGLWSPTHKGRSVLQEFADYTQVEIDHSLLTNNCPKLIHLDRLTDDKITFSRENITLAFKSMLSSLSLDPLVLDDVGGIERKYLNQYQHTFLALHCVEWLTDRLTVASTEEAEMVAAEFVLFGWISLVLDKSDKSLSVKDEGVMFKTNRLATYYVTERGYLAAGWKTPKDETIHPTSDLSFRSETSSKSVSSKSTSSKSMSSKSVKPPDDISEVTEEELTNTSPRPPSMTFTDSSMSHNSTSSNKDSSNFNRLYHILETPLLRMYFREFLKANYCTENIMFWVDYDRLLRNYKQELPALEQLAEAYSIYETFLDTNATFDVNIDHMLRQEIIQYVHSVFTLTTQQPTKPHLIVPGLQPKQDRLLLLPPQANLKPRTFLVKGSPERCLLKLIGLLGRVNDHVCKMMAEDSVPKFIRTHRYKELVSPKLQDQPLVEEQMVALQRVSVEDQRHEIP